MNGTSIFIIGQGRSGKSGLATDFIENKAPIPPMPAINRENPLRKKWIIIAPSLTHPRFYSLDHITDSEGDEPLRAKILRAYAEAKTHLLILTKSKNTKLFQALMEENENGLGYFYGYSIYADEAAIVSSRTENTEDFEDFIRQVGQKNILFVFSSHRIQADIAPVVALNTPWIFWVGPLADPDEVKKLYRKGNLSQITPESLEESLLKKPKYNWWDEEKDANSITPIKTA